MAEMYHNNEYPLSEVLEYGNRKEYWEEKALIIAEKDNTPQFLTDASGDEQCSRCGREATKKIIGGTNCYYCGNEVKFCPFCFESFLEEMKKFIKK